MESQQGKKLIEMVLREIFNTEGKFVLNDKLNGC